MNFGNPQRPEIMGQFVGCIEGMAEACRALDFPIVSGNVSPLQRDQERRRRRPAPSSPRPAIGGVGLIAGLDEGGRHRLQGRRATSSSRSATATAISASRSGCASCTAARTGRRRRSISLAERAAGEFVRAAIAGGAITACHDVSDGGLAVALAEMALAGGYRRADQRPGAVRPCRLFRRGSGPLCRDRRRQLPAHLPDARPRRRRRGRGDRPHQGQPPDLRASRRRPCRLPRRSARRA